MKHIKQLILSNSWFIFFKIYIFYNSLITSKKKLIILIFFKIQKIEYNQNGKKEKEKGKGKYYDYINIKYLMWLY